MVRRGVGSALADCRDIRDHQQRERAGEGRQTTREKERRKRCLRMTPLALAHLFCRDGVGRSACIHISMAFQKTDSVAPSHGAGGRHLRSGRASESVIWPMMSGKFLRGMDGQLPPQGWIPARRAAAGRRRADSRRSQFTKFCQGQSVSRGIVEKAIPLQSLRPSVGQLIPCCLPICPSGEGTPWSPFALVRSPLWPLYSPSSTSTLASRYPFSVRVSSFPDIAPLRRR